MNKRRMLEQQANGYELWSLDHSHNPDKYGIKHTNSPYWSAKFSDLVDAQTAFADLEQERPRPVYERVASR